MNLRVYLVKRLGRFVITLLTLLTILFGMFRLMPSDPTAFLFTGQFSEEARQNLVEQYGLARPIHEQYVLYIVNFLQGDFGRSFFYQEPVFQVILPRLLNTLLIMVPAVILIMTIAYLAGSYLGWNKNSRADQVGSSLFVSFRALPHFVLGLFLLMIFSYYLGWLPSGGIGPIRGEQRSGLQHLTGLGFYRHAILPFLTFTIHYCAEPFLLMRGNISNQTAQDYVRLLQLKGLKERDVLRHASKNASLPFITYAATLIGIAFGGQIMIEVVYSWPGIGRLLVDSVVRRDYPVAQAAFFLIAFIIIFTNLIIDILYAIIDPRIQYD